MFTVTFCSPASPSPPHKKGSFSGFRLCCCGDGRRGAGGLPQGGDGGQWEELEDLLAASPQVTILEADSRIGGRILTYRDRKTGWIGELGAMRMPSSHR